MLIAQPRQHKGVGFTRLSHVQPRGQDAAKSDESRELLHFTKRLPKQCIFFAHVSKAPMLRHRKVLRNNIQGITKPAIRRLARRGGVKRISGLVYEETRTVLKVFLENTIRDGVTYTEHARRKTVSAVDIVHALKRQGRTLYGFDGEIPPLPHRRTKLSPLPPAKRRNEDQWIRDAAAAPKIGSGVVVRQSIIPNAGLGLYASRGYRKNEIVTEYSGEVIERAVADKRRLENSQSASHMRATGDRRYIIDGLREPVAGRGGGSFANQALEPADNNVVFKNVGDKVLLVAKQTIPKGREVFIHYGSDYVW
jgi:histone H4